jgi:hypothetical protein
MSYNAAHSRAIEAHAHQIDTLAKVQRELQVRIDDDDVAGFGESCSIALAHNARSG